MGPLVGMLVLGTIAAAAATAVAVGVIWWAIFGDKARGRRRCPRCWHDLSRTPGLTCSECGHAAQSEADLGRARRRWGTAVATLVAVAVIAVWAQSVFLNQSWPTYLPDAVLVRIVGPLTKGWIPSEILDEASDRLRDGSLDADEVLTLAESVVAMAPAAGAHTDPMAALIAAVDASRPEELDPAPGEPGSVSSAKEARRRDFEVRRLALLDQLPPWIEATPLDRVPAGGPGLLCVRGTVWGTKAEWRVREVGSDAPWLVGDQEAGMRRTPAGSVLSVRASPDAGRLRCELETAVRRRTADGTAWGEWSAGPRLSVDHPSIAVDLSGLEPVDDEGARAAALACFDRPVVTWESDETPVALRFQMMTFGANGFGDLLVGITAEVLEDGVPRRRSRLWWSSASRSGWVVECQDAAALRRLRDASRRAPAEATNAGEAPVVPGWTLRITSDRATAARALGPGTNQAPKDRFWAGSLELPLRASLEPGDRARRTYWFDPIDAACGTPRAKSADLPDKSDDSAPNP